MKDFFGKLPYDEAERLDRLTRLTYDLRENRKGILAAHDAQDEAALLAGIASGEIDEHPGYENYLAARILWGLREEAREMLTEGLKEVQKL